MNTAAAAAGEVEKNTASRADGDTGRHTVQTDTITDSKAGEELCRSIAVIVSQFSQSSHEGSVFTARHPLQCRPAVRRLAV